MRIQLDNYDSPGLSYYEVQDLTSGELAKACALLKREMALRGVKEISLFEELSAEEKALARGGEKILAIKAYRARLNNGISLRECKEAIDQYIDAFTRAGGTSRYGW